MPSEAEKCWEPDIVRGKTMDTLASKVGSVVVDFLGMIDAGIFMPTWYGTFLGTYCSDRIQLGYLASAVGLLLLASWARVVRQHKTRTYFELFPRTGGDVCKLCELLSTTMSHYDKTGRRT